MILFLLSHLHETTHVASNYQKLFADAGYPQGYTQFTEIAVFNGLTVDIFLTGLPFKVLITLATLLTDLSVLQEIGNVIGVPMDPFNDILPPITL